jgi:hypothetical protein
VIGRFGQVRAPLAFMRWAPETMEERLDDHLERIGTLAVEGCR